MRFIRLMFTRFVCKPQFAPKTNHMAYMGKVISNDITGQSIAFITTAADSNGQLLEMVTTYRPFSQQPPAHYHPVQHETFTVLQGELTVIINGETLRLTAGSVLDIPRNTVHCMWNSSAADTVVRWKVVPALQTEYLLETAMGLAADGKTDAQGRPGLLHVAQMALRYSKEFRLAKPPYPVQRVLFMLLAPLALLTGSRAMLNKYVHRQAQAG